MSVQSKRNEEDPDLSNTPHGDRVLKIEEKKNKGVGGMPDQEPPDRPKMGGIVYNNDEKGLKDNVGIVYMSGSFRKALAYLGISLTGRNLNQKDTILYIAEALSIPLLREIPLGKIDYRKKSFKELKEYVFTATTKKYEIAKAKDSKAVKLGKEIEKTRKSQVFKTESKKFAGYTSNKVYFENEGGETETLWEEIQRISAEYDESITLNVIIYFKKIGTNKVIATEVPFEVIKTPIEFNEWLEKIRSGSIVGSDARSEVEYDLITDYFSINSYSAVGEGNSTYICWETEDESNNTGKDCGVNAMRKCGYEGSKKTEFKSLPNLLKVIQDEKLPIRVVSNMPSISYALNKQLDEKYLAEELTIPFCSICKTKICLCENGYEYNIDENHKYLYAKNPCASKCAGLNNNKYQLSRAIHYAEHFRVRPIYEPEGYTHTIIYCANSKHFSVAKNNELVFKESIWYNHHHIFNNLNFTNTKKTPNPYGFFEKGIPKHDCPPPKTKEQLAEMGIEVIVKEDDGVRFRYLIFDFETTIDFTDKDAVNLMKPYSMSVLLLSVEEMESLEKLDNEKNKEGCEAIRSKCAKTFIGYDCINQFFTWLALKGKSCVYRFCGFNNSNFDNYFLFNELMKADYLVEEKGEIQQHYFKVGSYLFSGSSLLSLTIQHSNYGDNNWLSIITHDFFDLAKHLVGSLAENCKGWKVNCCGKLSFNHHKAQVLYDTDPQSLIDFCSNNEELKTYNEFDCMSVAVIIQRYKNTLNTIPCVVRYLETFQQGREKGKGQRKVCSTNTYPCITTKPTIGGLVYGIFKNECKLKEITFKKLPTFVYDELMRCKVAGRVEMFNGAQKIKKRMASLDVCSLYPYVLSVLDCYYPSGKIIWEQEFAGFEKFGFYWVSFSQEALRAKNLPNIFPLKTETENDWAFEGMIENVLLSTTTIKLLNDFGVPYEFIEQEKGIGFTFSEYHKSCEMFEFVLEIMKLKNEQDTLKSVNSSEYNAPLRETLKLLMNAISGKVIEDYHTESTMTFENNEDFWKEIQKVEPTENLADKDKPYKSVNCVSIYGDRLVCRFETHKVVLQENIGKEQRPIYLGCALYDYAKNHMYRHSYSQIGLDKLVYTDTDATKTTYKDFLTWRKYAENTIVPHHKEVEEYDPRYKTHKLYDPNSKVFGSFEDELNDYIAEDYEFYCLQKKTWLYRYGEHNKFRFKGVNKRSLPISSAELKTLKWVEARQRTNKETDKKETLYRVNPDYSKETYYYHAENPERHLGEGLNATMFYRELYKKKSAYVLCSSFRKHATNNAVSIEGEELDMTKTNLSFGSIESVYMLKKIKLV
jgi:hypothetical protein